MNIEIRNDSYSLPLNFGRYTIFFGRTALHVINSLVVKRLAFVKFSDITRSLLCGATLFWNFSYGCPVFQISNLIPRFHAFLSMHDGFLRFIYGMTPADLLPAKMAAQPI